MTPSYRYALIPLVSLYFVLVGGVERACAQASTAAQADWGEDQYAIAAQHYRQQRWQQAAGQFRLLLEREPKHARVPLAKFFLAESHVQMEEYADSLPHFQSFLEMAPEHALSARAKFRLGEAYYLLGRDQEAIRELTALLTADQERQFTEFTLAYLGEMLLKADSRTDLELARDYLQRVVRDYPESSLADRVKLGLAQAWQKLGDSSAAIELLLPLRVGSDPIIGEEAVLMLAALWIERGETDLVLANLNDTTVDKISPIHKPQANYWRGRAEMAAKNWEVAGSRILESAPHLLDTRLQQAAWYDAAVCFWQLGDLPKSKALLQQSIEKWPTGEWAAESLFLLLQASVRDSNRDEIKTQAESFLARFPKHELANKVRETLGRRALNDNDHAQAETQFQALLAANPATVENSLDRATWHYLLGLSQIGLTKFAAGIQELDASLSLLPLANPPAADPSLEEWVVQNIVPTDPAIAPSNRENLTNEENLREQVWFARASVLMQQKRWSEALEVQTQILRENPNSSFRHELWADRLRAYVALRDWTKYQSAAEVAKTWAMPSQGAGSATSAPGSTSGKQSLLSALHATTLAVADHWYETQDYAQAITWYEMAANADDEAIAEQALCGLAWAEFQTRPTVESEATARLLLDRFSTSPRSAEVGLKLAEQQFRDGRYAAAEDLIQTLLPRFAEWPRRHQLLALQAKLLARQTDSQAKAKAIQSLELAIVELDKRAETAPQGAPSSSANVATYLYELAWLHHDLGQDAARNKAFERINVAHVASRYWADATFRLAQDHLAQGRLPQAKELVQQLLSNHPSHEPTADVPQPSSSVPALSASFGGNPGQPNHSSSASEPRPTSSELLCHALYLRSMIAVTEKDWPAAAEWTEQLIVQHPEHRLRWMAQFWAGEALFRQRKFSDAVKRLAEVIPRTDERTEPWVAMTHLRLAQSLGHLDRWEEALTVAEPARRRFTDFTQAFELDYVIGRALATEARFPQARAAYQQVIDSPTGKQSETAAMAQWMIGETYFHQEQFALAAEAYHRTETLYRFPQWQAAALLQAGKCYEQLGRPQDAISVYRQLLNEHANCTLANQAETRLAKLKSDRQRPLVPANPLPKNRLRGS